MKLVFAVFSVTKMAFALRRLHMFFVCPPGVNLMTFISLYQLRGSGRLLRKLYGYLPIESKLPFHFINKAKYCMQVTCILSFL